MLAEQLVVYVVAVAVATVVFIVVVTRHVNVNLSVLVQALPAILAAVAAIQRSVSANSTTQETAAKVIDLADRTRAAANSSSPAPIEPPPASASK